MKAHVSASIQNDASFDSSKMIDNVWESSIGEGEEEVDKHDGNKFFAALVMAVDTNGSFDEDAYDQMWGWVDSNAVGHVSKEEMTGFWSAML